MSRSSFGVKLSLTIFLLELEIQSPLHFCGAPSIERIRASAPQSSSSPSPSNHYVVVLDGVIIAALLLPSNLWVHITLVESAEMAM